MLRSPSFDSRFLASHYLSFVNSYFLTDALGIPSYSAFLSAIRSNRIEAQDLVQSAITSGRLSEDTLNDTEYLNSVDVLLDY